MFALRSLGIETPRNLLPPKIWGNSWDILVAQLTACLFKPGHYHHQSPALLNLTRSYSLTLLYVP